MAELISNLVFVAVVIGLLLLLLMASEQNSRTMFRVWGATLGMAILVHLAF